jgi:hypothetical protein
VRASHPPEQPSLPVLASPLVLALHLPVLALHLLV